MQVPSEDARKRRTRAGLFWCQCAVCGLWFEHRNRNVRLCGASLDPPEAYCGRCDWPSREVVREKPQHQFEYDEHGNYI
jgi:hypothetical protein